MSVISARRGRLSDEIIPVSVEHSGTYQDNEEAHAAAHAIDQVLETYSANSKDSDGKSWLKVNLAKLHCIRQVKEYTSKGKPWRTWICTSSDCSTCRGGKCGWYRLTTSAERTSSDDLPLIEDCKYGDTVKIERLDGSSFRMYEIPIIGKQGEIRYW